MAILQDGTSHQFATKRCKVVDLLRNLMNEPADASIVKGKAGLHSCKTGRQSSSQRIVFNVLGNVAALWIVRAPAPILKIIDVQKRTDPTSLEQSPVWIVVDVSW
jgi:hypothetical protein